MISILLDFRPYIGTKIRIIITMNVRVDGKLLQRQVNSDERIIDSIYVFNNVLNGPLQHNMVTVQVTDEIKQTPFILQPGSISYVQLPQSIYAYSVTKQDLNISISGPNRKVKFDIIEVESKFNDTTVMVIIDEEQNTAVSSLKPIQLNDNSFIFDLDLMILPEIEKPSKMLYRIFTDNEKQLEGKFAIS